MATITITITDLPRDQFSVATDTDRPTIGQAVTPAQALAMELLGTSYRRGAQLVYDARQVPAIALAQDLLDPEQFGHAVTAEVRNGARRALGRTGREKL